jgi:serine/threonine-protein kinase RsbW
MGNVQEPGETQNIWPGLRAWWLGGVRSTAELSQPLHAVADAMTAAGYPANDIFAVRLVLEEALVNAIRHGHRGDPSKVVRLRCWGNDSEVVATVKDQGDGFRPEAVPDPRTEETLERPSGRGLLLMRAYATSLIFNTRGNALIFRRRRSTE